ncbi:MAG TPA: carbohydrate ABC transporter permease [Dermatophilaceae bacterium]|jgi:multiple sugar transport system permease protein
MSMRISKPRVSGLWVLLGVVVIGSVFPVYWTVSTSLKLRPDTFAIPPKWFFAPVIDSYTSLFSNYDVLSYLSNSVLSTLGATLITLVAGSCAAYALSVIQFRGRGIFLIVVVMLRMVPPIVLVTPLYQLSQDLGVFDTVWVLVLVYSGLNIPFAIWLLKGFFDDVPRELLEAGMVDGCTRFAVFRRILIPVSLPGFFATAVFTFVLCWNDFLFAYMLTSSQARTLPVFAVGFMGDQGIQWGQMTAAGTVILVPVIVFSLLVQRWLVKGLTAGGVKG